MSQKGRRKKLTTQFCHMYNTATQAKDEALDTLLQQGTKFRMSSAIQFQLCNSKKEKKKLNCMDKRTLCKRNKFDIKAL